MYKNISLSLSDLLGRDYTYSVAAACGYFGFTDETEARAVADEKIDFYPKGAAKRNRELLFDVGRQVLPRFVNENSGAPTDAFAHAQNKNAAPLSGFGCFRIGEDGRLYLLGKSEHYHASLGHSFPGYRLIDNARRLGIPNATHNNTRGYITRLCERKIVMAANGISDGDEKQADVLTASHAPKLLNRVINLETGSLAVEAGVKMMLARFYKLSPELPSPKYGGKTPVFFVIADADGKSTGNYHGTTVLTQTFRGLWEDFRGGADSAGLYKVVPVKINDITDFAAKLEKYNRDGFKTAGFLHEIILMNYGGIRLTREYLQEAYSLCAEYDTPVLCDEIQTCMWYGGMFLFRKYGLSPDFAVIGKGFPGGEYPASRIITTAEYDNLNQFGALVTNGQEELASLAYLITMRFCAENTDEIDSNAKYFEDGFARLYEEFPDKIVAKEGMGFLGALHFHTVDEAAVFSARLKEACIDASAQLYKANCVPAVLFKPPVISEQAVTDKILSVSESILKSL